MATNNTGLIHGETDDIKIKVEALNAPKLRDALSLHDGINAVEQGKKLSKKRYGTTVKEQSREDGTIEFIVVSDGTDAAIDAQRYEYFTTDTCRSLVKRKASLFTSDNQTNIVTIPDDEDVTAEEPEEETEGETTEKEPTASEQAQDLWLDYREKGQANLKLIRADRLAVLMRVSGILPTWRSRKLAYNVLTPYSMFFGFTNTIIDDGVKRPTVPTEIEDASVFVIENLQREDDGSEHTGKQRTFTAWVGQTELYPNGRLLTYTSDEWHKIPKPSDVENRIIFEDVNNPLTEWSNRHPEYDSIEYPIMLLLGTEAGAAETLLPTEGLDLAETCLEIDLFVSRAMTAILESAVGLQVNSTEKEVTHQSPYPNVTSGRWWGKPGQSVEYVQNGSEHALNALDFIERLKQVKAENNDVPGYMVAADATTAPESGIALAIRTMPMQDDRKERAEQAQGSIARLFEIEKRLTDIYAEEGRKLPINADLSWNPGQLDLPESETERIANIKALEDAKYIDHVEGVRQANQLNTRGEAEALIEEQELDATPEPSALDKLGGGVIPELEEDIEEI
jgi:hypothetical protein